MMIEPGIRVVRGRDWCWQSQDGGEGFVGTVIEIGRPESRTSPDKTVIVQWDFGGKTNYRVGYQRAFDLRMLDNATVGVRHNGVRCASCRLNSIRGMRWKCASCAELDLCTKCYMADRHSASHPFLRIDVPGDAGVPLPPRRGSTKIPAKGLFQDALVVRGLHWDWGNQDGGEGSVGRIVEILGWETESSHSVARVRWASGSGLSNVYRVGHKGKVDLRLAPTPAQDVNAALWGHYYRDHLPLVGEREEALHRLQKPHRLSSAFNHATGASSKTSAEGRVVFFMDDVVMVAKMTTTMLRRLQDGHGGWNEKMADYIGRIGYVHRITERGDVRVQFPHCTNRWTFHPNALRLLARHSMDSESPVHLRSSSAHQGAPTSVSCLVSGFSLMEESVLMTQVPSGVELGALVKLDATGNNVDDLRDLLGQSFWRSQLEEHVAQTALLVDVQTRDSLVVLLFLPPPSSHYTPTSFFTVPMSACLLIGHCNTADMDRGDERHSALPQKSLSHEDDEDEDVPDDSYDGDTSGAERLVHDAAHGALSRVRHILQRFPRHVDIRSNHKTALMVACHEGHSDVVLLLLRHNASITAVDEEGDTPLHYACFGNQPGIASTLLSHGAAVDSVNSSSCTPLHVAVNKQHSDCVAVLLQHNANINLCDAYGDTALHDAIVKSNQSIVAALLDAPNWDFAVQNRRQFNALHHAALKGNAVATRLILIRQPQMVDVKKPDGFAALHLAALNGHWEVVKALLEAGADGNLRNNKSQTSVMLAASQGHLDTLVILLDAGCSTEYGDESGNNCLHSVLLPVLAPNPSSTTSGILRLSTSSASQRIRSEFLEHLSALSNVDLSLDPSFERPSTVELSACGPFIMLGVLMQRGASHDLWASCRNAGGKTPRDLLQRIIRKQTNNSASSRSKSASVDWVRVAHLLDGYSKWQRRQRLPVEAFCVVCGDDLVEVTFEPCGHRVCCADCCVKMRRCIKCHQNISNKKRDDGSELPNSLSLAVGTHPSSSEGHGAAQSLRHHAMLLEDIVNCDICMDKPRSVAFQCGHTACGPCSDSLSLCHMCRAAITQRINLFFATSAAAAATPTDPTSFSM